MLTTHMPSHTLLSKMLLQRTKCKKTEILTPDNMAPTAALRKDKKHTAKMSSNNVVV